jgi:hypothetical protein
VEGGSVDKIYFSVCSPPPDSGSAAARVWRTVVRLLRSRWGKLSGLEAKFHSRNPTLLTRTPTNTDLPTT